MPRITLKEMRQYQGIGASEVAAVCHLDPWRTARELWEMKTGRREKDKRTAAMEFGIEMESTALAHYLRMTGQDAGNIITETQVCAVHPEITFLRAIADGWNGTSGVQIKCPSGESTLESMRRGVIPRHYMLQCAAEMSIFEAEDWDFFVYDAKNPDQSELAAVGWDNEWSGDLALAEFWDSTAIPLIKEFWERMCKDEWKDVDRPIPPDNSWKSAIAQIQSSQAMIDLMTETKDDAKAELQQMMGFNSSASAGGWRAFWQRCNPSWSLTVKCDSSEALKAVYAALKPLEDAEGVIKLDCKESQEGFTFQVKQEKNET